MQVNAMLKIAILKNQKLKSS